MISETGYWLTPKLEGHLFDYKLADNIRQIFEQINIKTFWDLGCGPGNYVRFLTEAGFQGDGIEGNTNDTSDLCYIFDLTSDIPILNRRDATICLEVGEHIPKQYQDKFIENVKKSFSKLLILSWAIPGQEGIGHVNCKTNIEVMELFLEYRFNYVLTNELRRRCDLWYLRNTLLVFNAG